MTAWGTRLATGGCLLGLFAASACGGSDEHDARAAERTLPTTVAPSEVTTLAPATSTTRPASTTAAAATTATTAAATTAVATTSTAATTTSTLPSAPTTVAPTTLPPTTVPPALPQPIAPPPEDGSTDPRVELGTIEIPRIGLQRSLQEGIRMPTLDRGPGHWPGTAMPGEIGNVVVAGHRVSHNADFRHLDQLQPGDEVIFTTTAGRFVYLVDSVRIVGPDAMWIVDQTPERTATLFACHPPGSVRERIVVHLRHAP